VGVAADLGEEKPALNTGHGGGGEHATRKARSAAVVLLSRHCQGFRGRRSTSGGNWSVVIREFEEAKRSMQLPEFTRHFPRLR
jgi:hypothetical protein